MLKVAEPGIIPPLAHCCGTLLILVCPLCWGGELGERDWAIINGPSCPAWRRPFWWFRRRGGEGVGGGASVCVCVRVGGGSFTAQMCGPHLSNLDEWLRSYIIPLMSDYFYLGGSRCKQAAGARKKCPICGSGLSSYWCERLNFSSLTKKADGGSSVFCWRKPAQMADGHFGCSCYQFMLEQPTFT